MSEPQRNETNGFVTWQALQSGQQMQKGWQCGACGVVLAPWVASHECVKAAIPDPNRPEPGVLYKTGSDAPAWEYTTDPAERGKPGKLWAGPIGPDDALRGLSSTQSLAGDANT